MTNENEPMMEADVMDNAPEKHPVTEEAEDFFEHHRDEDGNEHLSGVFLGMPFQATHDHSGTYSGLFTAIQGSGVGPGTPIIPHDAKRIFDTYHNRERIA